MIRACREALTPEVLKFVKRGRRLLTFPYHILKDPRGFWKHFNRFKYDGAVLRKSKIGFTPSIFLAVITEECNLRCPTCCFLLQDPSKFIPKFITTKSFSSILERYNKDKRAEVIFLSGGEPLLHPDFDELIAISKSYRLIPRMSTNGILIKEKISAVRKMDHVNVSIDAYDYESYKKNRGGSPKQFDSIMEGLAAIKDLGMRFSTSFLLHAKNLNEIDHIISLAEKIGPGDLHFHNINTLGSSDYAPLTISDSNTVAFLKKMLSRTDYPFDICLPVIFDSNSHDFLTSKCVQPWYYFVFNTAGDVAYCCQMYNDAEIGNVFADYDLNSEKMMKFRDNIINSIIPKECLYCERRFTGKEFARFNAKKRSWSLAPSSHSKLT